MTVIHKKDVDLYDNCVYIGRPSKFGNPFQIGVDGSRPEVLQKFEEYFYSNIELQQLVLDELTGKTLVCWCKPHTCHGDIYETFINKNILFD